MEMTQVLVPYNNIKEILTDLDNLFLKMEKTETLKPLEDSYVRHFNTMINRLLKSANELDAITLDDSQRNFNNLLKITKKSLASFSKLQKDEKAKNLDIKVLAHTFFVDATASISDFKMKEIKVKEFVKEESIPPLPQDVYSTLAKSFVVNRAEGISIFDDSLNEGEKILPFKKLTKAKEVVTYGTDVDPEKAQKAKDNGVDNVAKLGIKKMSRNTFDIVFYQLDSMTFLDTNSFFKTKPEVIDFGDFIQRRIPKKGGYLIFHLPYYRIPEFQSRINNHLRVEGIYRVDDEVGNMLFVTTYRNGDYLSQSTELRRAFMVPTKMPHYTEMENNIIDKGDLTLPELFKAKLYDERDYIHSFKDEINSLDFIESLYEPKEKVVEFNHSIQQLRIGHFPAVATIGVANGIYDTSLHKDVEADYPHLFAAKIVQQEVSNSEEELENGKLVELVSIRKRNKNVFKSLLPDGTVKSFLNA